MSDFIKQMRSLIRMEDTDTARIRLTEYLRKKPGDVRAWVLLSYCVDDQHEKRYCLESALSVDPSYEPAQKALAEISPRWYERFGLGVGAVIFGVVFPVLIFGGFLFFASRAQSPAGAASISSTPEGETEAALPELTARSFDDAQELAIQPAATEASNAIVEVGAVVKLPDIPAAYCVPQDAELVQVEVVAITEPDTLMVALGDEIVRVRYLGVSMEELNNQAANHALIANQSLQGQLVTLVSGVASPDADGTLPRYVFSGDYFINFQMLQWGLAKVADEGMNEACSGFYLAAQLEAMGEQVGHWKPIDVRMNPEDWQTWPVIPRISENAKQIYLRGVAEGNNARAFSIYGDCQSLSWRLFQRLDWPSYDLPPELAYMQSTRDYFYGSYGRNPVTTVDGATVASMFSVYWADPAVCESGETPLQCELRVQNPSIALITLGTNWEGTPEDYGLYLRRLVETSIAEGILPIIVTKVDGGPDYPLNRVMAQVAYDYDIPLWNFWLAVQELPNSGMDAEDPKGIHFLDDAFPIKRITGLMTLHAILGAVSE